MAHKLRFKKRKRRLKIIGLKRKARRAKKRAKYLASPKGLVAGTIKGLPRATGKVLSFPFRVVGKAVRGQLRKDLEFKRKMFSPKTPAQKERARMTPIIEENIKKKLEK